MEEALTQTNHTEAELDVMARELLLIIFIDGEVFELSYDDLIPQAKTAVKTQLQRALAAGGGQTAMTF